MNHEHQECASTYATNVTVALHERPDEQMPTKTQCDLRCGISLQIESKNDSSINVTGKKCDSPMWTGRSTMRIAARRCETTRYKPHNIFQKALNQKPYIPCKLCKHYKPPRHATSKLDDHRPQQPGHGELLPKGTRDPPALPPRVLGLCSSVLGFKVLSLTGRSAGLGETSRFGAKQAPESARAQPLARCGQATAGSPSPAPGSQVTRISPSHIKPRARTSQEGSNPDLEAARHKTCASRKLNYVAYLQVALHRCSLPDLAILYLSALLHCVFQWRKHALYNNDNKMIASSPAKWGESMLEFSGKMYTGCSDTKHNLGLRHALGLGRMCDRKTSGTICHMHRSTAVY